jgi:anti-sigma factor RsiW
MNDPVQLSCQELVELVTDYLEGALPEEDVRRFEEHLGICSACVTYVQQMRTTIALTGRANGVTLDPEVESALLHAFRGWKSG